MKRVNIITRNKEIYNQLNNLHIVNKVIIENVKPIQINRIINSINKNKKILDIQQIGNKFLIKKINKTNYNMYHSKTK